LVTALRLKINALDASGAQAAYTQLDANLGRLLPSFLRQNEPLSYEQIRAGLSELRPTAKARRLDATLDRFLAQLAPMESALEPAIQGFFGMIRETALIIHPAMLKDAVSGVYDSIRDKLHVLDPDELAGALRSNLYEPLIDPLRALDPAALGAQLDALFQSVLGALTTKVRGFIDQLKTALDGSLAQARQAVAGVLETLKQDIAGILEKLQDLIAELDGLIVDDLFGRLLRVLDNLQTSFDEELDRVQNEFDAMLNAIPLGSSGSQAAVSV
jgi:uncharacterized protein (DUF2267 family)